MEEAFGDVEAAEAPQEEGAVAWGGEGAEEASEPGRRFWWSRTGTKVCFSLNWLH